MGSIREAAVAGTFYPRDPKALEESVMSMLDAAPKGRAPKAAILPHAGYVYSGPVAASGYRRIAEARGRVTRVVLIGPAHYVDFVGIASVTVDALATPLGPLSVEPVSGVPSIHANDEAHRREHSLEVHLPFLKVALGDVKVIPLAVGRTSDRDVERALTVMWGGPETLVIASSDLSHYLGYDEARRLDTDTVRAIETGEPDEISSSQACGSIAVRGLLRAAGERGLAAHAIDVRSSGDTTGTKSKVVGYGAFVMG